MNLIRPHPLGHEVLITRIAEEADVRGSTTDSDPYTTVVGTGSGSLVVAGGTKTTHHLDAGCVWVTDLAGPGEVEVCDLHPDHRVRYSPRWSLGELLAVFDTVEGLVRLPHEDLGHDREGMPGLDKKEGPQVWDWGPTTFSSLRTARAGVQNSTEQDRTTQPI